jgi:hypothetical protein
MDPCPVSMPDGVTRFAHVRRLIKAEDPHTLLVERLGLIEVDDVELDFRVFAKIRRHLEIVPYD